MKLKVPLSKIYSNTLHSTENMNCWNCWYGSLTINNYDSLKLYEKPVCAYTLHVKAGKIMLSGCCHAEHEDVPEKV